jgi:hypothetical protein
MPALGPKRKGEDMTEEQESFAAWCAEQGVPFACTDDLEEAVAILSGWGVLRSGSATRVPPRRAE